ncbi:MAG: type II toxin-antitoxin system HicA family toxin [Pseudomonadota bacterium]|nr:type II toxin-antitoxin system HicA family toxin [Pseudomonadota bacterium]
MPRLPVLSGQEVIKILERLGFGQVRQRGSHVLRRDSAGCVVPLHKEIKTGTLAGILRQAGVQADEFIKAK